MANRKSTRNIGFRVTEEEWRQFDVGVTIL